MEMHAKEYYKKGLHFIQSERFSDAVESFTKAIKQDPHFADAYHNRGEAYILLNRYVEGNTDIQRAKDLRAGKYTLKKPAKVNKLNMQEVDSIYDSVFSGDADERDSTTLEFDDNFYDYVFSDHAVENGEQRDEIAREAPDADVFPAILEYLGGEHLEVAGALLFRPTINDVSVFHLDGKREQVLPLEQFGCIRMTGIQAELSKQKDSSCYLETIETIDGNVFKEFISLDQGRENVLFGFTTDEQSRFTYSFIPKVNIRRRCQQRFLGEVLLEKRFIAHDMLERSLDEFHSTRSMKIGKIIAQKSHVPHSEIEEELKKSEEQQFTGLKTGEILLAAGVVSEKQVLEALDYQESLRNMKIGQFLVKKGIVNEKEIYVSLAEKHRLPFIDLRQQKVSKKILSCLPSEMVLEHEILPIEFNNGTLVVATHSVDRSHLCELILKRTRCNKVQFVLAQPTHLRNIIRLAYKRQG